MDEESVRDLALRQYTMSSYDIEIHEDARVLPTLDGEGWWIEAWVYVRKEDYEEEDEKS